MPTRKQFINLISAGTPYVPPTFSPTDIAGLKLWVKADSLALADTDPVPTWDDDSGNGYDLVQGTEANQPTYIASGLNSKPIVRFDGTGDNMQYATLSNLITVGSHTIFVVVRPRSFNTNTTGAGTYQNEAVLGEFTGANMGIYLRSNAGSPLFAAQNYPDVVTTASSVDGWYIIVYRRASGSIYISTNGGTETTAVSADITLGSNPLAVGCGENATAARCGQVDIAELLIYNTAVSAGNVTDLLGYLNAKWAVY
jgi:hypothetical protein